MGLTVDELVSHPRLGIRVLVPAGLEREIRWVHATEQADPTPYLRGGEILLTDGLWLDGPDTADAYVRRLRAIDVAAIGYGPMPEAPEVPGPLIRACERHGMCLFAMPPTLPFIAVTEVFVDRLAEDREAALAVSVARNARFLETARSGGGAAAVLRLLEDELTAPAWVAGRHGQVLCHGTYRPSAADRAAVALALADGQRAVAKVAGGWRLEPILAVDIARGFLAVAAGASGDESATRANQQRAIVEQALPFLGMELAHAWALSRGRRQPAAELVELALAGEAQLPHVAARLGAAGLAGRPLAVAVCEPADGEKVTDPEAVLDGTEAVLADAGIEHLAALRDGQVVAIMAWQQSPEELLALARRLYDGIGVPATVGVGSVARTAGSLRTSMIEARHACRLAAARRDGLGHGSYADVGSYQLLLDLHRIDVLRAFSSAVLEPIVEYDRANGTELVPTLRRFLELDGGWQETADALHIHVNTLRNRLARIETLTGRPLRATEARVDLFLALRAAHSV